MATIFWPIKYIKSKNFFNPKLYIYTRYSPKEAIKTKFNNFSFSRRCIEIE